MEEEGIKESPTRDAIKKLLKRNSEGCRTRSGRTALSRFGLMLCTVTGVIGPMQARGQIGSGTVVGFANDSGDSIDVECIDAHPRSSSSKAWQEQQSALHGPM